MRTKTRRLALLMDAMALVAVAMTEQEGFAARAAVFAIMVAQVIIDALAVSRKGQRTGFTVLAVAGLAVPFVAGGATVAGRLLLAAVLLADRCTALTLRRPDGVERDRQEQMDRLRGAWSVTTFALMTVMTAALAMALTIGWVRMANGRIATLIGLPAALLGGIGLALALERLRGRAFDPTHQLLLGLLMAGIGLMVSGRATWFAIMSGAACAQMLLALIRAGGAMRDAARFVLGRETALGREPLDVLYGLAAVGLGAGVIGCGPMGGTGWRAAAWLVLAGGLVSTFLFPLSSRWIAKVRRWLELEAAGRGTPERTKQLEEHIIRRSMQPFLLHFLESVVRPVFGHRVVGAENVKPDDENPIVYLCNHGDLYGPVAAWITIPTEKRPWTIAHITEDVDKAEAYLYKYDWSLKTWMPDAMRHFMARLVARFAVWATHDLLEAVPVWRDSPRQLINTFRLTVEALQCGDDLLIFPENPNAAGEDHGYETEGVGELFSGFAMLAQVYYNKTGKRCRFLPMFAHRATRTVTFGTEIVYDPDNDSTDERNRIADETARQMKDIWQRMEESCRK